jgi:diguanylate cyclase (GGDEF)-like protein
MPLKNENRPAEKTTFWRECVDFARSFRDEDYQEARVKDLALFSVAATFITAVFVALTVFWDYGMDPARAHLAIELRLAETAALLVTGIVFWLAPGSRWAYLAFILGAIFVELTFIEILARLDSAAVHGLGGFLYFFIFVPFIGRVFSLAHNVFVLLVVALIPLVGHIVGFAEHLNLRVFNAYVWLVFGPVVLMMVCVEFLQWRTYQYRERLARQAHRDALTNLPNRRYFFELVSRFLPLAHRDKVPVSLLFLDLDHFKGVNDQFGHEIGDHALQAVAAEVQPLLRKSDVMARMGGEEFVIWLHGADEIQALESAARIRMQLDANPIRVRGLEAPLSLTVSIGIATCSRISDPGNTLKSLLRRADEALYRAKKEGRNRVCSAKADSGPEPSRQETASV